MIRGLHHTAISTPDLDRLVAFYCERFGCETVWETEWPAGTEAVDAIVGLKDVAGRLAMLRTGTAFLELIQFLSPPPKRADPAWRVIDHGLSHICFDVTDIAAEIARLSALGVPFNGPPVSLGGPVTAAYCRDPDGNIIELLEVSDAGWPTHLSNRHIDGRPDR